MKVITQICRGLLPIKYIYYNGEIIYTAYNRIQVLFSSLADIITTGFCEGETVLGNQKALHGLAITEQVTAAVEEWYPRYEKLIDAINTKLVGRGETTSPENCLLVDIIPISTIANLNNKCELVDSHGFIVINTRGEGNNSPSKPISSNHLLLIQEKGEGIRRFVIFGGGIDQCLFITKVKAKPRKADVNLGEGKGWIYNKAELIGTTINNSDKKQTAQSTIITKGVGCSESTNLTIQSIQKEEIVLTSQASILTWTYPKQIGDCLFIKQSYETNQQEGILEVI